MTDDSSESFEKGLFGNRKNKGDGETPKGGETPNDAKKPRLRERIKGVFNNKGNKDDKKNDGEEEKVDTSSTYNDSETKGNDPTPEQSLNDEGQEQSSEADQTPEQPPEGEAGDQTPEQPPEDEAGDQTPEQPPEDEGPKAQASTEAEVGGQTPEQPPDDGEEKKADDAPPGTPYEQRGRDDLGIEDEVSKFDTELSGEDIEKPRSRMEWVLQGASTHLNLAADVASAVDRGLRSARSIVKAAMNPSATGLNEAQTMIAETIKNLDSVAETISDISGTADDVVKRMARNAEDKMKAQFAYMIDRIGGGKDLTEFSQEETDHLFAAMKDIWGKDAERLAEGKNPAVAKAIRQTYGKAIDLVGRRGKSLKTEAIQTKRDLALDKKETKEWAEEDKEREAYKWLEMYDQDDPVRHVFNTLVQNGATPYKAAMLIVNNGTTARNKAMESLRTKKHLVIEAKKNGGIAFDQNDMDEMKQVKDELDEFHKKITSGVKLTPDEQNELNDLNEHYDDLQKRYREAKTAGMIWGDYEQGVLDRINTAQFNVQFDIRTDRDYIAFTETLKTLFPGMENENIFRMGADLAKSNRSKFRNMVNALKAGKNPITVVLDQLTPIKRSELYNGYAGQIGDLLKSAMKDENVKKYVATANFFDINRGAFKNIEGPYFEEKGISPRGNGGGYTQDFMDYVSENIVTDDKGEVVYNDNGQAEIKTPEGSQFIYFIDHPKVTGKLRGNAISDFTSIFKKAMMEMKNLDDLGEGVAQLLKNSIVTDIMDISTNEEKLFKALRGSNLNVSMRMDPSYLDKSAISAWNEFIKEDPSIIAQGKDANGYEMNLTMAIGFCKSLDEDIRNRITDLISENKNPLADDKLDRLYGTKMAVVNTLAWNARKASVYTGDAHIDENGKLHAQNNDKIGISSLGMGQIMIYNALKSMGVMNTNKNEMHNVADEIKNKGVDTVMNEAMGEFFNGDHTYLRDLISLFDENLKDVAANGGGLKPKHFSANGSAYKFMDRLNTLLRKNPIPDAQKTRLAEVMKVLANSLVAMVPKEMMRTRTNFRKFAKKINEISEFLVGEEYIVFTNAQQKKQKQKQKQKK